MQAGVEAGRPHRPILAGKGIDGRPDGVSDRGGARPLRNQAIDEVPDELRVAAESVAGPRATLGPQLKSVIPAASTKLPAHNWSVLIHARRSTSTPSFS